MTIDIKSAVRSVLESENLGDALADALAVLGKPVIELATEGAPLDEAADAQSAGTYVSHELAGDVVVTQLSSAGRVLGRITLTSDRMLGADDLEALELIASAAASRLGTEWLDSGRVRLETSLRSFADVFVHDAKTPLTSISGMAQTLRRRDRLDSATQDEFIERIEASARDLETQIDRTLAEIQVCVEAASLCFSRYNLAEELRRAANGVVSIAAPDEVWVIADIAFLRELLERLIAHVAARQTDGTEIVLAQDGRMEISGVDGDEDSYTNDLWANREPGSVGLKRGDPLELVRPCRMARVLGGSIEFEFDGGMRIVAEIPLA